MELKDLKDEDLELRQFIIDCVKYQKFKTKVFIERSRTTKYTNNSKRVMFEYVLKYLFNGIKVKNMNPLMYKYLDEAIQQHVCPLIPSEQDKRRPYHQKENKLAQKKDVELPVEKLVKGDLTETFEYGVRFNDNIRIFEDEEKARLFLEGINFVKSDKNADLMQVKCEVIR